MPSARRLYAVRLDAAAERRMDALLKRFGCTPAALIARLVHAETKRLAVCSLDHAALRSEE